MSRVVDLIQNPLGSIMMTDDSGWWGKCPNQTKRKRQRGNKDVILSAKSGGGGGGERVSLISDAYSVRDQTLHDI